MTFDEWFAKTYPNGTVWKVDGTRSGTVAITDDVKMMLEAAYSAALDVGYNDGWRDGRREFESPYWTRG